MKSNAVKEAPSQEGSPHLAANLSQLLKTHRLNANQLAQQLGIPMMTIRRLMSGETTDPRLSTLKLIANHFNMSVDALTEENKMAIHTLNNTKHYCIPLLDWETAERIRTVDELDLNEWEEWQSVSLEGEDKLSDNAFALVSRPSMYLRFPQGTVFIIEPTATVADGDMVLIRFKKNEQLSLRDLRIDPPDLLLHPVVSGSNVLLYSERDHDVAGVVLLTMFYNRKGNN